jgi:hypothetical protein
VSPVVCVGTEGVDPVGAGLPGASWLPAPPSVSWFDRLQSFRCRQDEVGAKQQGLREYDNGRGLPKILGAVGSRHTRESRSFFVVTTDGLDPGSRPQYDLRSQRRKGLVVEMPRGNVQFRACSVLSVVFEYFGDHTENFDWQTLAVLEGPGKRSTA